MICKQKTCKSSNIVSNISHKNIECSNDFYVNKNFGKINIMIQILWCADCGEPYNSSTLNISKQIN